MLATYQCLEDLFENDNAPFSSDIIPLACCAGLFAEKTERPKVTTFLDCVNQMSSAEFSRHFRVSVHVFQHIVDKLTPNLIKEFHGGYQPVSVETQILVFLWYVANQNSQREIALLFGLSEWSVNTIIHSVAQCICDKSDCYIKMANAQREVEISNSFYDSCGIDNIVGVIDGTHIPIVNCPGGENDYINRKGFPSVQLQLVVDDNLMIMDAYVGWPGSTHDARVLRNSAFFNNAETGRVISTRKFIIGDGAYPLKNWLITPYRDNGHLRINQRRFNRALSSARQCVERANALLKGRFRRLQKLYCHNIEDICKVVLAACVLHNLCILCEDEIEQFIDMNQAQDVNNYPNIFANNADAVQIRDTIANTL